jgi:hypothetical protein
MKSFISNPIFALNIREILNKTKHNLRSWKASEIAKKHIENSDDDRDAYV